MLHCAVKERHLMWSGKLKGKKLNPDPLIKLSFEILRMEIQRPPLLIINVVQVNIWSSYRGTIINLSLDTYIFTLFVHSFHYLYNNFKIKLQSFLVSKCTLFHLYFY